METTIKRISSGVYSIEQDVVRSFLIVGTQRAMLLDTGAEPCDLMGLIRSVTDLPVLLLQTHADGDHTANSALFTDLYIHPAEQENLYRFRPDLKARLHPITKDTSFDLGGRLLQVIESPGHTPGSVCLLDRENRILFSGDTVSYGPVFLFGAARDIHSYRKTLDMLMELGGFDTVYPCHGQCPVSLTTISALQAAVDGALDGTLQPQDNPMPMPTPDGVQPLLYTVGKCGILYC